MKNGTWKESLVVCAMLLVGTVGLGPLDLSGCAHSQTGAPSKLCGNGTLDEGEECDDGNNESGDGCSVDCKVEASANCGNGTLDEGEECDDGNNESGDGCNASCHNEYCGDGVTQSGLGEECDDGNNESGDGCSVDCKVEASADCGNGTLDQGEECDDGNNQSGDGCNASCHNEYCGDGVTQSGLGEECDDGNNESGDGCSASCTIEPQATCGDGTVDPGEECDDGNNQSGDGCNASCHNEYCGDGVTQSGLGEECDDGNNQSGDGCNASCHNEYCGDGVTQSGLGEECDDGNNQSGDGCNASCHNEYCGDGVTQSGLGEECDDGNNQSGDGCNASCHNEYCGDGTVQAGLGEQCDNGTANSDSQPNACRTNCHNPTCGDGVVDSGEQCDDHNTSSGDGCSSTCQVECDPNTDIALMSGTVATSSGGGTTAYDRGPENMIDGHGQNVCGTYGFHWVDTGLTTGPNGKWIQLTWSSSVTVARISIDTISADESLCGLGVNGRPLSGGSIQYWNGSTWQTVGTVSGQANDWTYTLPSAVRTTKLRIYDVTSTVYNPVIVEWHVYSCN